MSTQIWCFFTWKKCHYLAPLGEGRYTDYGLTRPLSLEINKVCLLESGDLGNIKNGNIKKWTRIKINF